MSIRRTTTLGTLAGLVLASAAAGPAAAQSEPTVIPCFEEQEVAPGDYVLFVTGWGTGSRGALKQFLASQTTLVTVTVDEGDPVTTDPHGRLQRSPPAGRRCAADGVGQRLVDAARRTGIRPDRDRQRGVHAEPADSRLLQAAHARPAEPSQAG
jgi:hypothetical protein